jgi:hypothetical protein
MAYFFKDADLELTRKVMLEYFGSQQYLKQYKEEIQKNIISPAKAYEDFCNENRDALLEEIKEYRKKVLLEQKVEKIINKDIEIIDDRLNPDILSEKIKKTLEEIEVAVNGMSMPLAYADQLYVLREHISMVKLRFEKNHLPKT